MKRQNLLAAVIIGLFALTASAWQFAGNLSTQTYAFKVFNVQAGVGPSAPFRNIGATSHWLSYCTANSSAVEVALEASNDGVNWFQISNLGNVTGCTVITASGYYQNVRADIYEDTSSGGTASVTAWYTASTFPISNTGVLDVGVQPRPVTQVAASPVFSSGQILGAWKQAYASPAIVNDWYVYNPNATGVFANISTDQGVSPYLMRYVPAASGIEVTSATGVSFPTAVYVACSATQGTLTNPTTDCYMDLSLKPTTYVNTLVSSSGAVQERQTTGPH